MRFGLNPDRMIAYWSLGEEDLAAALASVEGFAWATHAGGTVEAYRRADGLWERRIVYIISGRDRDRRNARTRDARRAEEKRT